MGKEERQTILSTVGVARRALDTLFMHDSPLLLLPRSLGLARHMDTAVESHVDWRCCCKAAAAFIECTPSPNGTIC